MHTTTDPRLPGIPNILGIDHIVFAVPSVELASLPFLKLGFEKLGHKSDTERQFQGVLLGQAATYLVLETSKLAQDGVSKYIEAHGPGISKVVLSCSDAIATFQSLLNRGALPAQKPTSHYQAFGAIDYASVWMSADIELGLISRTGRLFFDGYNFPLCPPAKTESTLINGIDHLSLSVKDTDRNGIYHFLANVLGWTRTEHRDWFSSPSNLEDSSWCAPMNRIVFSVNEASEDSSRSKLFTQIHHGSGWHHLCFSTDRLTALAQVLKRLELGTLALPTAFYQNEEAGELAPLHIAFEKDGLGQIRQVFSAPIWGDFFLEFMERQGETQSLGFHSFHHYLDCQ